MSLLGQTQTPLYSLWNSLEKYSEQYEYMYSDPRQDSSSMQRTNCCCWSWGNSEDTQEAMPPFLQPTQRLFLKIVVGYFPISIVSTDQGVCLNFLSCSSEIRSLMVDLTIGETTLFIFLLIAINKYPIQRLNCCTPQFSPNQYQIFRSVTLANGFLAFWQAYLCSRLLQIPSMKAKFIYGGPEYKPMKARGILSPGTEASMSEKMKQTAYHHNYAKRVDKLNIIIATLIITSPMTPYFIRSK